MICHGQKNNPSNPAKEAIQTTGATSQINKAKRFFPVVALSIYDNIKVLENIRQRFRGIFSWNKYKSKITIQPEKVIVEIIWLIQPSEILIDCLYFHSTMEMMILKETLLINITHH